LLQLQTERLLACSIEFLLEFIRTSKEGSLKIIDGVFMLVKEPKLKEEKLQLKILNLVVCILLRVLDQVQGFPSNATQ
jgi:hypothetical protein